MAPPYAEAPLEEPIVFDNTLQPVKLLPEIVYLVSMTDVPPEMLLPRLLTSA
jgi:hypothetical protein